MSQPKVFEFAKEIGMSPLALMDKIREWKLPVRSHMAELEPEVLDQIRTKLKGGDEPSASSASSKKKIAKKAAPAKDDVEKPAAKKKAAKKTAAPAAAPAPANAKAKSPKAVSAPPVEDPFNSKKGGVVRKAPSKVVVRKKEDEDAAALAAKEAAEAQAALEAERALADQNEADARAQAEADEFARVEAALQRSNEAAQAASLAAATASTAAAAQAAQVAAAEALVGHPTSAGLPPVSTQVASPQVSSPTSVPVSRPSASAAASENPLSAPTARKREVVMTAGGPSSGIKSEPRRNIVGRMDLSRVQAPAGGPGSPGAGPASRPGGPAGFSSGPRTGGYTGGNPASRPGMPFTGGGGSAGPGGAGPRPLRTGFVSSGPVEVEDEATLEARRRFDEKRGKTKPGAPGSPGAGGGGREEEVVAFAATEFRKREMVFQPKKKKGLLNRVAMKTEITKSKASKRVVKVDQSMKLADLANEMGVKAGQLTKALMQQGVMATMNTVLDYDTIALIAPEFDHEALNVHESVAQMIESTAFGDLAAEQITRPPVVTIMGHVDHGKTSLLDVIRKANVASGEAGGITQHIGAYQVKTEKGHMITFIDTPGHEAFTAMRTRGANATDIAIIVVAADDGAMPQTIESISHAKAAGVPIIVAVNKMDKAGANPDRVKQQLTEQQLVPEEWGGETIYVPVSAHTKMGINELLEQIDLVAEVQELKANPKRSATGVVIESRMDKGRGPVATLLVQDGTLELGQSIVVGHVAGRVRGLINDKGERVKSAGPSVPVEVQGLSQVPLAGDKFDAVSDDQAAARIASERQQASEAAPAGKISLEDIFAKLKQGDVKELNVVLKADVAGSQEAIKGMFDKMGTAEVKPKIIHAAVGGINESDVLLASSAKAIVVGFNVRPDSGALSAAKRLSVDVRTYTIVYELVDDMKKAMGGMLTPDIVEKQMGRAEVRNTFSVPKAGTIAGCFVVDGKISRNSEVRLLRDSKIVYTGKLGSLKRFKDDAKEVATGFECGMSIENFNDIKVGDVIEAFVKETVNRELH